MVIQYRGIVPGLPHFILPNAPPGRSQVVPQGPSRSLSAGKASGVKELVDRDWYWWLETKATPVQQFFRIEIKVALEEDQQDSPLYTLVGFMSADLQEDDSPLTPPTPKANGNFPSPDPPPSEEI